MSSEVFKLLFSFLKLQQRHSNAQQKSQNLIWTQMSDLIYFSSNDLWVEHNKNPFIFFFLVQKGVELVQYVWN